MITHVIQNSAPVTRVCAMRANLITPSRLISLLNLSDINDIKKVLSDTEYSSYVNSSNSSSPFYLEHLLWHSVIDSIKKLLRFAKGEVYEFIRAFLFIFDVLNIKTIIRIIHYGRENPDINKELFNTGKNGLVYIDRLEGVTNFATLTRVLENTFLYNTYVKALDEYRHTEDMTTFQMAIDEAYFTYLIDISKRCGSAEYIEKFICVETLLWTTRFRFIRGLDAENIWRSINYPLPQDFYTSISEILKKDNLIDAINYGMTVIFPKLKYNAELLCKEDMDISEIFSYVRSYLLRNVHQYARSNPFTNNVFISYFLHKRAEVHDIICAIEAVSQDFDRERAIKHMIIPKVEKLRCLSQQG